ncbi:MAG: phage tail assembly chaperone [Desulfovibrionaceae bacterium]|nr:phage tail assembly chaperone [Desulfovibrionaceae bacterium]
MSTVPEGLLAPRSHYRQALREVPEQEGFPDDVVWPEKPGL